MALELKDGRAYRGPKPTLTEIRRAVRLFLEKMDQYPWTTCEHFLSLQSDLMADIQRLIRR